MKDPLSLTSTELLPGILEGLPGMVYRCRNDSDWTMLYVSSGCLELTGYPPEELIGVSFSGIIHPEDRRRVWDEVQAAIDESRPYQIEYRICRASGEERWVYERGCALASGEPVRDLVGFIGPISSLRSHELEQRAGEARFQRFYESVYAGVIVRDAVGALVYANPFASEILGFQLPDGPTLASPAARIINEDGVPIPTELSPSSIALRTGAPVRGSVVGVTSAAGEPRWVLVNAEPVLDPATGAVREVITSFIDVTERRRAEQHLHYRLAFESLISQLSSAMVDVDPGEVDSGILHALQSIGEFAGVDRAYVFQLRADGRIMDNTHEWCAPGVSSQIHRLQNLIFDERFPWMASKLRALEIVHVPRVEDLLDEARLEREELSFEDIRSLILVPMARRAALIGFVGFDSVRAEKTWSADSITLLQLVGEIIGGAIERQRAEQALRASEDRLRTLFQNLSDVVMIVDARGRLRFETPSIQRLLRLRPADLEEVDIRELCAAEDVAIVEELLAESTSQREARRELRLRRADGTIVDCEVLAANLLDHPGIGGIVLTLRDISERRQAEEERRRLELQLQQTQRLESLGILAGGVAHDFNNLLTGVIGEAGLALAALPPESPVRESVRRMEQAALRAAELTQQLLAYSGKGRVSKERVQLRRIVEEMAGLLQLSVSRMAVLEYRFAPQLPPVEADVAQLHQVIMNLILNAAEACTRGGLIQLSTGTSVLAPTELSECLLGEGLAGGEYVWLEVSDNGSGMSPEVLARIFEPFFTTKFTGRGLGLAAVLGIVRGHGGAIRVESQPGVGTRFRVLLPARRPEIAVTDSPLPRVASSIAPAAAEQAGPATILVVDDDSTVRLLAQTVLEHAGYRVLVAVDGPPAIELVRRSPQAIGLVLLDVTMPRMSGGEVLRSLRALRPDLPILLSSGFHETDALDELEGQPAGFLQKPYTTEKLLETVRRVLRDQAGGASRT